MELPPVNPISPLLAMGQQHAFPPPPSSQLPSPAIHFDVSDLQLALTRSRQEAGGAGGLRRATSAPHSMDALGQDPRGKNGNSNHGYLAPSGGPMRRVSSSLGMRRSASFFWTPAAHHDFERAVAALTARGTECSASAILNEMSHRANLQLSDVDNHLRKRMLVQRRVLQTLVDRPPLASVASQATTAAPAPTHATTATQSSSPTGHVQFGTHNPHTSPIFARPSAMAAVAEEEPGTAAAAAVLSEGLAYQLTTQKLQHLQLAAAREALLTHAERQLLSQQQ